MGGGGSGSGWGVRVDVNEELKICENSREVSNQLSPLHSACSIHSEISGFGQDDSGGS